MAITWPVQFLRGDSTDYCWRRAWGKFAFPLCNQSKSVAGALVAHVWFCGLLTLLVRDDVEPSAS